MLKTKIKPFLIIAFLLLTVIFLVLLFPYLRPDSYLLDIGERTYLHNKGEIIIAAKESFLPFSCGLEMSLGYEIDLINLLRSELKADIKVIHMPWLVAIDKLNNNEIDAISGMRITSERKEKYHFTTPYLPISHALVLPVAARDVVGEKIDPAAFIKHNTIAAHESSATMETVIQLEAREIVSISSPSEAISLLQEKHIDGWVENHQVALYFLYNADLENEHLIIPLAKTQGEYAMAFSPENSRLATIFDKALRRLIVEDKLLLLDKTWFGMVFPRPQTSPSPLFTWLFWGG